MNDRVEMIETKLRTPMLGAALLTVPAVVIEVNDYPRPWPAIGFMLSAIVWLAFLFEFFVMMRVVPDRRVWVLTHKLETSLLVIAFPVLPAGFGALRLVRLVQIARLGRLAKLARISFSMKGLPYVSLLTLLLVLAAGSAFAAIEKGQGIDEIDGLWWSLSTVTTVGYGDISPHTEAGRAIALFVMMLGIGFVALLTASIAQYFVKYELDERAKADPAEERAAILSEVRALHDRLETLERSIDDARRSPVGAAEERPLS